MFQEIGANAFARGQAPASIALQQFSALVERYPNVSEVELARLINLYRELSALDLALISDEKFGPKLDRFVADHRSAIRTPFRQYAILVAIAAAGFAILVWALTFGP